MTTLSLFRSIAPARVAEPSPATSPSSPVRSANPVHEAFARHVTKHLCEGATLTAGAEIEVPTWPGRQVFLVDFLIAVGGPRGRRIAVECSGGKSLRDHAQRRRRDARLVATGAVDALYRLSGHDLGRSVEDALYLIASWERTAGAGRYVPDVFSARGRINLARLSSLPAKGVEIRRDLACALVSYPDRPTDTGRRRRGGEEAHLLLRRFDRRFPDPWASIAQPAARPVHHFYRPTGS